MQDSGNSSRKWSVLAVVLVGIFMAMVDSSIVNMALPTIVREMHVDFRVAQWVPLAYMLTVTCLIMVVGRLGDLLGKRLLYCSGFAIFTLGSLLCGLASTLGALVAWRVLQGVGAAIIMALSPAILVTAFPANERGRALGFTGAAVSAGVVIGPSLGGVILSNMNWGWIFFVNLPFGVIGTVLTLVLIRPESRRTEEAFDVLGAAMLAVGLFTLLLGVTGLQKDMIGASATTTLLLSSAVILIGFVWVELRRPHPLVDLRLFSSAMFTQNLVASFLNFMTTAGTLLLIPFYLQVILNLDTRTAGLALAAMPIAIGVTAPFAGWLADRHGTQRVAFAGLLVLAAGFYSVQYLTTTTSVTTYVLQFIPVGIGIGLFQSPNNSAILGSVPRERVGVASAMLAVTRTLGQTTGLAFAGAFWAVRVTERNGGLSPLGGPSRADPSVQLAALHDTYWTILLLTGLSMVSVLAALWRGRQRTAVLTTATEQS